MSIAPSARSLDRDGDIISLGSQQIPDTRGGRRLTMHWEIKVATEQHGCLLAREQAAAGLTARGQARKRAANLP